MNLEKLDKIDWSELRTSFGQPAADVLDYIRRLASATKDNQDEVSELLKADLCNSYQVNTATLVAIPILLELLESSDIPA